MNDKLWKKIRKPFFFGLAHGGLSGIGFSSFMLYFMISEYNDPVTGETVLLHKYGLLKDICEWTFSISLFVGLALVVLTLIEIVRDKRSGRNVNWYLILFPTAIAVSALIDSLGMALIEILK